jgi:hypothetical protein
MAIFKAIFCWVYVLSSLTMLVSASPIDTSSAIAIANTTTTLISTYDPDFVNIEKRQKPKKNWYGGCKRVNVGQHNCPLMLEACRQYYRQFPEGDNRRKRNKSKCKQHLCVYTQGDCYHWRFCNWC